jgi:putative transposase
MPRPLRVEYPGAIYHLMNRGDHREAIFHDDQDRRTFIRTLGEACEKTGWQIHALCLMSNHFHLIAETPQSNLVVGMKWFLATYTARFNRRHNLSGHLFGGRYKSAVIDERGGGYLRTACDYVHLNPARAGLIKPRQALSDHEWSSYPWYLRPPRRPSWLRVDRLLGEHGIAKDSAAGRRELQRRTEKRRSEGEAVSEWAHLRRGWWLGAEDFVERLAERLGRAGHAHEAARERNETDEQRACRLVREWLAQKGWTEEQLANCPKGDNRKLDLARLLREQTPMTRQWIAEQLHIGSASYVSHLLRQWTRRRL